jgi:DNA-binding response OmpR family regulator
LSRPAAAPRGAPDVPEPPRMLALGELRYDLGRGELWNGAEPVRLTATESALMRIFAQPREPGEPLSRAQLVSDLGGAAAARARSARSTCRSPGCAARSSRTRKSPRYLQTVRGAGLHADAGLEPVADHQNLAALRLQRRDRCHLVLGQGARGNVIDLQ